MRIGILETGETPADLRDDHGGFAEMFGRLLDGRGLSFETWAVHGGRLPSAPDAAEGWLITGSKAAVYEDHAWIAPLEAFIRAVMAARVPLVGICFGHQIMAQATGGLVEKSDRGWGIGAHVYDDVTGGDAEGGGMAAGVAVGGLAVGGMAAGGLADGRSLRVLASHQDQVIAAPPGTRITARSAFCPVAGLAWDDAPALSWQAHPEFSPAFSEALIRGRRGTLYPADLADAALAGLAQPLDADLLAERIAQFLLAHRRAEVA